MLVFSPPPPFLSHFLSLFAKIPRILRHSFSPSSLSQFLTATVGNNVNDNVANNAIRFIRNIRQIQDNINCAIGLNCLTTISFTISFDEETRVERIGRSLRPHPTRLHFSPRFSRSQCKSPKSAAGRTNINNGMIMNQIVREKPISYWPTGANDWPAVYLHSAFSLSLSISPFCYFFLLSRYSFRAAFVPSNLHPSLPPSPLRATHAFFLPFSPRVAFPLVAVSLQRHERDRTTHTVHIFQLI